MKPTSPPVGSGVPSRGEFIEAWRHWDAAAVGQACEAWGAPQSSHAPELAYWRAMADLMVEGADALTWLDRAWCGFRASGCDEQAAVMANAALVLCLLDSGAMSRLDEWHARAEAGTPIEASEPLSDLWIRLGVLARVSLGKADSALAARASANLLKDLQPL